MILITGASGLVGRAVAQHFMVKGHRVRLHGRSIDTIRAAIEHPQVDPILAECVAGDLGSYFLNDYSRLVRGCDTVIHCGGLVHQPNAPQVQFQLLNIDATRMLAQASAAAGVSKFVFLSTSAVYGDGPFDSVEEQQKLNPQTHYARSKAESELWLQESNLFASLFIVRPSLVFGEGDRGNMLSLMKQIRKRCYVHVQGNSARKSIIYSRNLAHAIALMESKRAPGVHVYNGADGSIGVVDLANAIAHSFTLPSPPTVPKTVLLGGAYAAKILLGSRAPLTPDKLSKLMITTSCSGTKMTDELGYRPPYSHRQAFDNEVQWLKTGSSNGTDLRPLAQLTLAR